MVKRHNDGEEENFSREGDMARKILMGITIALAVSWIGYISMRGITTNDNMAVISKDVEVLKVKQVMIVDDLKDIKDLSRQIRDDQIRRQRAGK
jgi:hypothetical protein